MYIPVYKYEGFSPTSRLYMYFYIVRLMGLTWALSYSWGYNGWKGLYMDKGHAKKKKKITTLLS